MSDQSGNTDTYADDLAALTEALDLRHGTRRVAKAVLIGAMPPLMLNPIFTPPVANDVISAATPSRRGRVPAASRAFGARQAPPICTPSAAEDPGLFGRKFRAERLNECS